MTKVSEAITSVTSGSSTTGTEITAAEFVTAVTEFLTVTQQSFTSVKVTYFALTIVTAKVGRWRFVCYLNITQVTSITDAEKTSLTSSQVS